MEQRLRFYLAKTIELAKTITFKSDLVARTVNQGLIEQGYTVEEGYPFTWKYYLNLAGQYHETDTKMSVVSLDTLETIEFTTTNLANHRSTWEAYQYGTRFYRDLVDQYPDQETLIYSIVNPVDLDTAIQADEGTLLTWDDTLVDPNETDLIPRTERWIKEFLYRWNVSAYSAVDEYYTASLLGVLYSQLPLTLMNIRLSNVNTARAHGFHIREYLAGYQRLDEFYELLTLDQRLFLYRNLDYIAHNAGHQETFDMLVDNLLTRRGISLFQYDLRQNHQQVPTEQLYPEVDFLGENLNFRERNVSGIKEEVFDHLVDLNPVTQGNVDVFDEAVASVHKAGELAQLTQVPTKTLQARAVDASASYEVSFEEMLLNHWLYMSATGKYQAIVPVTNPVTGLQQSLTAQEAYTMYLYCWLRGQNVTLPTIPTFLADTVQRPTLPELEQMVEWYGEADPRLALMRDRHQALTPVFDPLTFNERVKSIHQAFLDNTWVYKSENDQFKNGRLRLIHQRFYQTVDVDLDTGATYKDWLLDRGVVVEDFTRYDFTIFAEEILTRFTGLDLSESDNVRRILNAMVTVMGRLSSYHVHYLALVENDNYFNVAWVTDRLGNTGYHGYQYTYVDTGPQLHSVNQRGLLERQLSAHVPVRSVRTQSNTIYAIDPSVTLDPHLKTTGIRYLEQPASDVTSVTINAL